MEWFEALILGLLQGLTEYYESLYLYYLLARIDQMNGETARYNESAALFNAQYDAFSAAYNRAHRPRGAFVDRREWT